MRKLHKYLGITLLLPFIGWVITGLFFFIKPGYQAAYESLSVRTYPLVATISYTPQKNWQQIKVIKTILGKHLLIKEDMGWVQLDPSSYERLASPTKQAIKKLIDDATQMNSERYGNTVSIEALENGRFLVTTDKQIKITLDWNSLSLRQIGPDTEFIDQMYKIHYLQWTGNKTLDKYLGVIGLAAVLILSLLGLKMSLRKPLRRN
ncbi:hypothetical protein FLL45_04635 [Aliikangiella marina]|uniref:PepSY domain-containing protein n=1 Tax=Aliikangiella marina TaxID=1712262 RepID=A0A545TJ56_9GAMM|nr:hypothetical protein [Aliikangiella marina]TQV77237.1 hypothetical protein FLL45_04635 [Aliikangiella marina]